MRAGEVLAVAVVLIAAMIGYVVGKESVQIHMVIANEKKSLFVTGEQPYKACAEVYAKENSYPVCACTVEKI
jgi:hypothetical protein